MLLQRPPVGLALDSSQQFIEPESSLPNSQELFNCIYPAWDQSSQTHPILSLQDSS
jgi:hypothetical protein